MNKLHLIFTFITLSIITSNEVIARPQCDCNGLLAAGLIMAGTGAGLLTQVDHQDPSNCPKYLIPGSLLVSTGGMSILAYCCALCRKYVCGETSACIPVAHPRTGSGPNHNFTPYNANQPQPHPPPATMMSSTNSGINSAFSAPY